ncbi:MAG: FKBP-type peptidyl-prolyl cis-trans isomerase [Paramuribaculum sp.]|nr:FKBP-type peptidyl-prolyl cis-trans isomerase [Paramuribaculum sp.]MDE6324028.1 FKBP-type peptidyl-prolyl cis-trans isomerase [Paramuribaculum sp.]MDE6488106.1 FKBP-type peptidyl-prolyl cis-trans isomerase [Paramuribaculum sp.]
MKTLISALLLSGAALSVSAQTPVAVPELKTLGDSISYHIGSTEASYSRSATSMKGGDAAASQLPALEKATEYVFALPEDVDYMNGLKRALEMRLMLADMKSQGLDVSPELFMKGYKNALNSPVKSTEEVSREAGFTQQLVTRAANELKARKEAELRAKAAVNEEAGAAYVAAQKKKDKKIKTTESGLSYKVLKGGKGDVPKGTDRVRINYTGKLIDGTVFDSSEENGPATFGVDRVIKGFSEGLRMMTPGSKYRFYIPADLGYGDEGAGDKILPGAMLIFDVELLEINPE